MASFHTTVYPFDMALSVMIPASFADISPVHIAIALLVLTIIGLVGYEAERWSARIPKFDGPRGLPIVGNLWQIRNKCAPEQYRVWARKYGGLYQVQLGHIPVLIINTAAASKAVLSQNSQATSSRPEFYTFHKVCTRSVSYIITDPGSGYIRHFGHDHWHNSLYRLSEKAQKGYCECAQQASGGELHSPARR